MTIQQLISPFASVTIHLPFVYPLSFILFDIHRQHLYIYFYATAFNYCFHYHPLCYPFSKSIALSKVLLLSELYVNTIFQLPASIISRLTTSHTCPCLPRSCTFFPYSTRTHMAFSASCAVLSTGLSCVFLEGKENTANPWIVLYMSLTK